jgi:hypothetical protein
MTFYGNLPETVFYGEGIFYGGPASASSAIPQNLSFYRTSQDGIYTFWWGFLPAFITPSLVSANFDLQLDTSPSFTSPNLVTFTATSAITYQNGNVVKGFTVPVAARLYMTTQTWYAQVRTHSGSFISAWSAPLTWTIPQSVQQSTAEALMSSLPDANVYGTEDLKLPLNQRKSLIYTFDTMYGQQFDEIFYENLLTGDDNYLALCRDEFLAQNFGVQFNFVKPTNMQYVDYRYILQNLIAASLNGSTVAAIIDVVQAFTGVLPTITNIRDLDDFYLNLISQLPLETPDGIRTQFLVTYEFVMSSMQIFKNGNKLTPGVDFTPDEALPGFIMTVAPAPSDILNVFYRIGKATDPTPVLFDPTVVTPLTGDVTYTNGSATVTGSGTLFTSQLLNGDILVDPSTGYYLTIDQILSDTSLILLTLWPGPTETVPAYKATYNINAPVLWDKATLAFGTDVSIFNPGAFNLDYSLIEMLVSTLIPASVKIYFSIVA